MPAPQPTLRRVSADSISEKVERDHSDDTARSRAALHLERGGAVVQPRTDATPLTAHGSHKRRIERSKTRSLPRVAEDQPLPRTAIAWRAALALVVVAAFATLVGTSVLTTLMAAPSLVAGLITTFGVLMTTYFVVTCWSAYRYRSVPSYDDSRLPMITLIVPAYNEGANVRVSLESAVLSDYPADRLEILAIDDGSTDDTFAHIEAAAAASPGRITAIRQPKNGGKREALREGFARAEGELIVTVDSDSKLEPSALRAIVAPMIENDEIAAVAGRVLVLNREEHLFTRLLSARFFLTFDLARAAQSQFGAVLCTPGALSAYRKSAVDGVVEQWSSQTFLGQPCTIAEDRALTTWLLRAGFRSVYQRTAVVRTIMPTRIRQIARMLVRWERGNIREDLVMLPLLLRGQFRPSPVSGSSGTKFSFADRAWPAFEIGFELAQYPIAWLSLGLLALRVIDQPVSLVGIGGSLALGAAVQCLWILRSSRAADFVFGVLYALFACVGLIWVFPYSLVTVRDGRWMTR
jgi:hyaluronan synthase